MLGRLFALGLALAVVCPKVKAFDDLEHDELLERRGLFGARAGASTGFSSLGLFN